MFEGALRATLYQGDMVMDQSDTPVADLLATSKVFLAYIESYLQHPVSIDG